MVILSRKAVVSKKYSYVVAAILLYAIIFGLRYGVGMDYFGYLDLYDTYLQYGYFHHDNLEIGFQWLVKITSIFHSSFIYFGLISFINLFFMSIGFKNNLKLFPYLFFVFMITGAWMSPANLARQCIAVSLWAWSLKYVVEKRIIIHYVILLIAISFHYSAVVLLPFYLILSNNSNWFKSVRLELILLIVALVLMRLHIVEGAIQRFEGIFLYLGYDVYMSDRYEDLLNGELVLGIGFFIKLLINIINIVYSEKVKIWLQNPYYDIIYNLYFVGVLLSYIFASSEMIGRVNLYFIGFNYIITAFTLYYSFAKNKQILKMAIISLVFCVFVAIMSKASTNWNLFVFKGQQEYYYLHKGHDRR